MNTTATIQYHPEKHLPSFLSALMDAPEKWMGDLLYPVEDLIHEDGWQYGWLAYECQLLVAPEGLTSNTCAAGGDAVFATILRRFLDLNYHPTLS